MVTSQKYESYKESEVPDLGKIPAHWKVIRNQFLFQEQNERSLSGQETHLCMSQKFGLVPSDEFEDKTLQSESYEGARLCKKGDLVLNRLKAHLSVFSTAPCDGLVSPDYSVFRLRDSEMIPKYFEHLFKTPVYLSEFNRRVRGIVAGFYRLYTDDFNDVRAVCPPIEDQKRIIDFLDRKTSEIDQAIARKQRLIELLQEQKAILINQAVTKGLNPKTSMRDSGITWIGRIPKHWNLPPMYARYRIELGKMLDSKKITGKYLVKYLRNTDVQWGKINITDLPEMDIEPSELGRFLVTMGDLLVCEGGDIGRCAIWNNPDTTVGYQKALHRVRPFCSSQENIKYLFYVMQAASYNNVFSETAKPNTISHLTREMFKAYRFPQPPKNEQDLIVQHLESVDKLFAEALEVENKTIDSLNEMKSILIANTVTGKIKI